MADEDQILYRVEDKVAVITLHRPHKANALEANGKHFSSGHDCRAARTRRKRSRWTTSEARR